MSVKELKTIIQLQRNTESYFLSLTNFIPRKGEVVLVDTEDYGLRIKIGNGYNSFKDLSYVDGNAIIEGYYLNNKFYTDTTYIKEVEKSLKKIYLDKNTNKLYLWNGQNYYAVTPEASSTMAGILKLYSTFGQNTDGTMTQKAITDGVNAIKLLIDEEDEECLVLDLPWD